MDYWKEDELVHGYRFSYDLDLARLVIIDSEGPTGIEGCFSHFSVCGIKYPTSI